MPVKKTYAEIGDACAMAHALDLVGDRWSLIVVRELLLGPRRFADLESAVIGITPGVLTARLRALEESGVVEQGRLDDLARTKVYRVTEWGRGLEDVMRALGRWAHGSPAFPVPGAGMTPDGSIVAMRTMAPDVRMADWNDGPVKLGIELGDRRRPQAGVRRYRLRWDEHAFELVEGVAETPDATVAGDSTAWTGAVFLGLPLAEAGLEVDGDRRAVERVIEAFAGRAA